MTVPALYINLDSDVARRKMTECELEKASLKAQRIAGIDGESVPPGLLPFFFQDGIRVSKLSPGEMGCYASHLKAMQRIVREGLGWALVIEDDVRLHVRLVEIVESAVASAPSGWDFLKLCRYPQPGARPLVRLAAGRTLVRYNKIPLGMAGYVVSASGAKKMLADQPKLRPFDVDVRWPWLTGLEVFGVTPPATPQDRSVLSSIKTRGGYSRVHRIHRQEMKRQMFFYNLRRLGPLWVARCEIARRFGKKVRPSLSKTEQIMADAERALAWHRE